MFPVSVYSQFFTVSSISYNVLFLQFLTEIAIHLHNFSVLTVVMSGKDSAWKRCPVRLYLQLFVGRLTFHWCYLCMFAHRDVQHGMTIWVIWRVSYRGQELCSPWFLVGSMLIITWWFCVVVVVVLFAFVLCLVCPVLPVFLNCQFCIALSVFYNIVYDILLNLQYASRMLSII